MENRSVLICVLVFGTVLYQAESVLRTTFVEDLCYNTQKSLIDLKYDTTGILMSVPQLSPIGSFDCEVMLSPPKGASVVLSIYRYDLYEEDLLTIEDSDRHMIALLGWASFKNEKKSYISDGKMWIRYKTGNKTSVHRRAGFQFTFTKVMNSPCSANEFKCDNGKCVLKDLICDGHNHCGDSSDQKKCGSNGLEPKMDPPRPEEFQSRSLIIWVILITIASLIVLTVIIVTVVVLVRRAKQKKASNGTRTGTVLPPRTVSSVPQATTTVPHHTQAASTVPHQPQAAPVVSHHTQTAPATVPSEGNTLLNRVRRSFHGIRSQPRVENVPMEQSSAEPYQVPSMYPSLDQIPSAPEMHGVDNQDFKIEE